MKIYESENGTRFIVYKENGKYYQEYQEYYAACGWRTIGYPEEIPAEDVDETYFIDLARIPVAVTNVEDHEEIIIETAVNVPEICLDMYVNNVKCDAWAYESISAIALEIKHISFDELVELGEDSEKRINELLNRKGE